MPKLARLICGAIRSALLLWFAVSDYQAAPPIAEETLRGLALTLTAAIEHSAQQDPSLRSLAGFHPVDVAFFAIIDPQGIIRFHSNPDLVGTHTDDNDTMEVTRNKVPHEARVVLGTGEKAFAFYAPLYVGNEVFALKLTLHTFRADSVIRRARLSLTLLISLLSGGWILTAILYRFAQREERREQEMAKRENLARLGEMGAMLAHEIRNPLAGIKGYAQVIEKKPVEERNRQFANSIVSEVLRLESLVTDLLAYARSNHDEMTTLELREMTAHTAALVSYEARQCGVAVENDCPEGVFVTGNRDRLGQLLLNLAKNAIQAMPDGGLLCFSAEESARNVIIKVSDTGQGMAQEILSRIFEPFFTTKARGTGLGLALCKKIVGEHHGMIEVASVEGEGTQVYITLPLVKAETINRS